MYPIEFVGFAGDCVVTGRVLLFADRLSDLLNHDEEFHVRAATLVVNRELAGWIRPTRDEATAFPDVPILEPAKGPNLAKDFTGMGGP